MAIGVRVEPELEQRLDRLARSIGNPIVPVFLRRSRSKYSAGVYSGKPRSAVVVQANRWLQGHPSVSLCPLTSTLVAAPLIRPAVDPSSRNGLQKPSQLMADKLFTVPAMVVG